MVKTDVIWDCEASGAGEEEKESAGEAEELHWPSQVSEQLVILFTR